MTITEFQKNAILKIEPLYGMAEARAIILNLIEGLLGYSSTKISLYRENDLSQEEHKKLLTALGRLLQNEPVQYITGIAHFWDLELHVTPDVLIPRQETEELVDWILKENRHTGLSILDIGTGSGCIALGLAIEKKNARVSAIDYSEATLKIAKRNASLNQAKIEFHQQDILQAPKSDFSQLDIIVSNPPYIRDLEKKHMMPHVLEHEPDKALFVPDDDPLLFYRTIGKLGQHWLRKGGKLYFEINEDFGNEVVALLKELKYEDVVLRQDLNGKDRMVRGVLSSYLFL